MDTTTPAHPLNARPVNNALYDTLGERWYAAQDDPVALLRAESRLRNPWVIQTLRTHAPPGARALDIGCGAGFLSNPLAAAGFDVVGLDASAESLAVAARHDPTGRVHYQRGNALQLPFPDASFDAVCAMDFLEHVEDPARAIAQAARVLRPGGLFFFHTFNRHPLAWLIVIKGVEWFVANTPRDMHVLRLFIRPAHLARMCDDAGLSVLDLRGSAPVVLSRAFWHMLRTGSVRDDFRFRFTKRPLLGYSGYARRR